MRIPILTFGAIASILTINSVFADTVVTSRGYVDTEVGKKQNTIPVSGTNSSTPGNTVITYTDIAGTIGERGICNDPSEDDCNGGDLVTVNQLDEQIERLDLQTITTTNRTCTEWVANAAHTDANCLLWNLVDQTVYGVEELVAPILCLVEGESCSTDSQCCGDLICNGTCGGKMY